MDPATLAAITALLKQGGLAMVAILASYLAFDYRKELREVQAERLKRVRELQEEKTTAVLDLARVQAESVEGLVDRHAHELGRLNGIIGSLQKRIAAQETSRADDLKDQADKMEKLTRELVTELTRGRHAMESLTRGTETNEGAQA